MKRITERREDLEPLRFHVLEETAPLRRTLTWGPTGVEAIIARYFPYRDSLFEMEMDVPLARTQAQRFEELLRKNGVDVISVKDLLAEQISRSTFDPSSRDLGDLEGRIISQCYKAKSYYRDRVKTEDGGRDPGLEEPISWVGETLKEDAEKYGERVAISLNEMLANLGGLPLGNILFGRDQTNVVGDTMIWSNMTKPIRQPEVDIWRWALSGLVDNLKQVSVVRDGRLEGGDPYVSNGVCYIGVGGRTNREGVRQVAEAILDQGMRLMFVFQPDMDAGRTEHQIEMHLDTFSMPFGNKGLVLFEEGASRRQMYEVKKSGGIVDLVDMRQTFLDHMVGRGYEIIPLSRPQQLGYQANFVDLSPNKVLLTVESDGKLRTDLEAHGIEVVSADLTAVIQGFGGAHCSISPLVRG